MSVLELQTFRSQLRYACHLHINISISPYPTGCKNAPGFLEKSTRLAPRLTPLQLAGIPTSPTDTLPNKPRLEFCKSLGDKSRTKIIARKMQLCKVLGYLNGKMHPNHDGFQQKDWLESNQHLVAMFRFSRFWGSCQSNSNFHSLTSQLIML